MNGLQVVRDFNDFSAAFFPTSINSSWALITLCLKYQCCVLIFRWLWVLSVHYNCSAFKQVTDVSLLWPFQISSRRNQKQELETHWSRGMQAIFLNNQIWWKHNGWRWLRVFHMFMWKSLNLHSYNQIYYTWWHTTTPWRIAYLFPFLHIILCKLTKSTAVLSEQSEILSQ